MSPGVKIANANAAQVSTGDNVNYSNSGDDHVFVHRVLKKLACNENLYSPYNGSNIKFKKRNLTNV